MVISSRNAARILAAAVRLNSPIMVYAYDMWFAHCKLEDAFSFHPRNAYAYDYSDIGPE